MTAEGHYDIVVKAFNANSIESEAASTTYDKKAETSAVVTTTTENNRKVVETTTKEIKLAKVVIKKAKSTKKKTVKLTWKKVANAKGYQVRYALKKSMAKAKKFFIKKNVTTRVIKKLKSKKTYYFGVRAYCKLPDGTTKYGAWSKAKKAKIK